MGESNNNPELMAELLGYHLGLVDDKTGADIEARLSKEELGASREVVNQLGRVLDVDQLPSPPADLVSNVMSRVGAVHATLPLPSQAAMTGGEHGGGHRPLMTLRELVGLAAAILLFVGIFVPGYRSARSASQQATCADHLRRIGNGYASYAEMFGGQLPYAGAQPEDASWLRPSEPGVPPLDNSRHGFLLINRRFVPAWAYICPGRAGDQPMEPGVQAIEALSGFPDARNTSFATQLVDGPRRRDQVSPEAPIASDMTPLAEARRSPIHVTDLPPNSSSHGRPGGQNVLFGNLTVRFVKDPNVGVDNDDIYRLIGVQEYTGRERPTLRSDAFLIP